MMGDIFAITERVIVWLGPDSTGVMDVVQSLLGAVPDSLLTQPARATLNEVLDVMATLDSTSWSAIGQLVRK